MPGRGITPKGGHRARAAVARSCCAKPGRRWKNASISLSMTAAPSPATIPRALRRDRTAVALTTKGRELYDRLLQATNDALQAAS
ncbi:hypothetical protein M8494_16325 [Serratia ureilytica]